MRTWAFSGALAMTVSGVRWRERNPTVVRFSLAVALATTVLTGACPAKAIGTLEDPLETVNRAMFAFNGLLRPTFRALGEAVHGAAAPTLIQAYRNLTNNLAEPGAALAFLVQGDLTGARVSLKRFLINGVEGPLGLRDIAAIENLPPRPTTLNDTLCHFGVPPGPYLVLPLYGDTTLRGAVAQVATLSAAFVILGEYYLGYRIMTYLLIDPAQQKPLPEMQFLENGHNDPYAAARARQAALEQAECDTDPRPGRVRSAAARRLATTP